MKYEIQIFTKDRKKIIKFSKEGEQNLTFKPIEWEDFYYAMGSVIDDKADRIEGKDKIVGLLHAENISFDEVVDVMCEDLNPQLTKILTNEKEKMTLELTTY